MRYTIDRYMNVAMANNVVWLADGKSLAYTTNITGVPQAWRVDAEGGYPEQLTYFDNRIWALYSLKKSNGIAFTMDVGGDEKNQIFLLPLDGSAPINLTANPNAVHQFGGIVEDEGKLVYASNARDSACFDICSMDLKERVPRIVLQNNDNYNWPASLSPNGRYLLYNKLKGQSDNALWMVDVTTGASKQTPEGGVGAFTHPVWTSDSSAFYLLADQDSEFVYLARYDLASGRMETVHKEDWDIEALALSGDDRYLAFSVNRDGYSVLKVKDLLTGEFVSLPEIPRGVISQYSSMGWSPRAHKLAFSLASGGRNSDIWVLDLDTKSVKQVTFSSRCGIQTDGFVEPELMRFKSFDGLEVPFWLYVPRGRKAKNLPVLVNIHGGPEGQERPAFKPVIQFLVNQGLAVAAPNVRGSIGYGRTYHHLDDVEKRMDSVADIDALVKHLIARGIADPTRIAVMGMSYGGFMTLASITEYPELWAAAVDIVGIANFESFLEHTSPYRRTHRETEYGSLEKHRDLLRRISPIHKADRIRCPLMVIHGARDPRVPVGEAEQIVESLQSRGREVEYLRYEDEGHGIVKLANKLDCYEKVASFLKKHLRVD